MICRHGIYGTDTAYRSDGAYLWRDEIGHRFAVSARKNIIPPVSNMSKLVRWMGRYDNFVAA